MICQKSEKDSLDKTAKSLKKGSVVIIPTDTVYGFSGIVDLKGKTPLKSQDLIRKIKGRGENKPFIHLIAKAEDIYDYTDLLLPEALISKWPGPLTVIVPVKKDCPLYSEEETVAFRCPGDKWLRDLIEECQAPLYSTSVNRSASPVLTLEKDIVSEFENECDLIVLDGDCKTSLASTIVKLENDRTFTVIRQGAVKFD